jgi:hypothetical protein
MAVTFLDGQANLAALSVPGVFFDILLPQPFIAGTPTNIVGLVGVGSWGPVNSVINGSTPYDVSLSIGPPLVRTYDMASYVAASSQVGGTIGYQMVRVTDGTDVAATGTIQSALTLTAKYTGVLGNGITASLQNGSAANSYMAVVSFPGLQPEQFNNVAGPVPASGTATFSANPAANDTLTIAGSAVTFVASGATGLQVNIGANLATTLSNLLTTLRASADTGIVKCSYALSGSILQISANQFSNSGAQAGNAGNSLTLAKTSTAIAVSGATLLGGTGTWQTLWTNLAIVINSGNAYSSPSKSVVATSLTSTVAPILSTPVTLSGGTDGASGVTDATLMGQDTAPRKGMYVLRNTLVSSFTLCDLSASADYAAISSFAIGESMTPVFGGPSGQAISDALTVRTNSGIDTPWFWYIHGNYPSFYDAANSTTRLVNPSAFGLGILGNLSPQQSPLNKKLTGISSTQYSNLGLPFSDTDLTQINLGGIDTILGPSQSPGGYYYSFASGRNCSSNTAANGIEYTTMTNFLARDAQSKAAGSFIGRLQSIQANDQTRSDAKALFDGRYAQLADPAFGLGINGQGMIDQWAVQCDLNNNTPDSQAKGYLFLYAKVRYLNVVRYFVVKFMGGGNVNVTSSTAAPANATI